MAIYRKKKFTSPKKVGGPEIGAAHKSQKVGGPPSPIGSAANDNVIYKSTNRGVVVNLDLGERFPRPRSQQRGSLRPCARRVRARGGCGRGSPPPAEGVRGVTPGNFFEIFDAKSRVWGQLGQKTN